MNTFERWLLTLTAATVLVAPMCAQTAERRATLTGGGGNDAGKCTIEVYVDGSADVEIRGDRGFLRTVSGQPAQWRRFECSGPIPANPGDFRFSGVDGRGRQELIQDPRSGQGAAVVRIQDPNGGGQGYTFDLMWRGAGFISNPTGQPSGSRDRGSSPNEAVRACQDVVRERANRQYGLREIEFRNLNADDNPGRNDTITGSFDVRRGYDRDTYRFSCAMNLANGMVRGVEISEGRNATAGPNPTNQPLGGLERGASPNDSVRACQDAVRENANRQYGLREIEFRNLNANDNPGRNDMIMGSFDVRRGYDRDTYRFSCAMNLANGIVRSVDISQRRDAPAADRYFGRDDATAACRRAAEQRIQYDGYRNVQFGSLNADNRRSDGIAGTATAQRGNNGRAYDFDVSCSVNLENGNVRSVQVNRR